MIIVVLNMNVVESLKLWNRQERSETNKSVESVRTLWNRPKLCWITKHLWNQQERCGTNKNVGEPTTRILWNFFQKDIYGANKNVV